MNCIKCNADLKEGAKFCGKCGTNQLPPNNPAQQTQSTPPPQVQASKPAEQESGINKVRDRIFWDIQPGELARRFNEAQLEQKDNVAGGIIINDGTTAYIKAGGEFVSEIHGGAYNFVAPEVVKAKVQTSVGGAIKEAAGILQRGFTFVSNLLFGKRTEDKKEGDAEPKKDSKTEAQKAAEFDKLVEKRKKGELFSVTLKLDKSFMLPILFGTNLSEEEFKKLPPAEQDKINRDKIKTKVLDTNVAFEAYFKIDDFKKFAEHYLGDKEKVTYSDLINEVKPIIKASIQSVLQDVDLNSTNFSDEIIQKIKDRITLDNNNGFFGVILERVITISTSNEALDRIRKKEGELAVSEKELDLLARTQEFRNRLTNQNNSQALIIARTDKDQAFELGKINNDHLLNEDELEKFRMVLSREKRIRAASNEQEIESALIDIQKTGLLKEEDLENLKRSILERSEDHDNERFHSIEIMQLNNTLEIDRKNLEWEYEIGDKRIQLEIDRRRKQLQAEIGYSELEIEQWKKVDDYQDSKFYQELKRNRAAAEAQIELGAQARKTDIDLDNLEMDSQLARLARVKEMEMADKKLEHEQAIAAEKQRLDQEVTLKEIDVKMAEQFKGMSFEQIMAANPNISPAAAEALAKKFEADAAASSSSTAAADAKENQAKMEAFMQTQMQMQMQMMNKMMDTSATMSGNLLQTQQQQSQKTEQRLERTEERLDTTQDKSLDYTTRNNAIDAVVSNNNKNQAPPPGYIKCMGCSSVENTVGTKFCFNCGREL
jgi:hypothetical protein